MSEIPHVPRRSVSVTAGSMNAQSLSTDLTTCVSVSRYTGSQPDNASSGLKHWGIHEHASRPLVDWITKGGCASEASGAVWLVSNIFNNNGVFGRLLLENLLTLSEQQLVDCITVDSACTGELMNNGFAFAAKNAICKEANYSYTCLATKGICKASLSPLMEVSRGTETYPQTASRL